MQSVQSSPTVACCLITSHLVLEAQASHPKSPQAQQLPPGILSAPKNPQQGAGKRHRLSRPATSTLGQGSFQRCGGKGHPQKAMQPWTRLQPGCQLPGGSPSTPLDVSCLPSSPALAALAADVHWR